MELVTKTAYELRDMLRHKEITSEQLVEAYYEKIESDDQKNKGYITLDKDNALAKAREVDKKIAAGETLPDLAGIPMGIKDNICTKGVKTTCASKMLENFIPPYNATIIEKLESQGAIMLGKQSMNEFAMASATEVVPGDAAFSIGTCAGEATGQSTSPHGLVRMKASNGMISKYGVISFSSTLDQVALSTKDVADMALVLNATVGHDEKDSTSMPKEYPDYTKSLVQDIEGIRIAMPKEYFSEDINQDIKQAVIAAADQLKQKGAIVEEVSMPLAKYIQPVHYIISSGEASSNLARLDGVAYGHRAKDYTDVDSLFSKSRGEGFDSEVKRRMMLGTFALSKESYDAYYKKAMQGAALIKKEHQDILDQFDIILAPTMSMEASANITGLPAISIPCGIDSNGFPIGMQLLGKAFNEETLLKAAYTFEQTTSFEVKK